MLTVFRLIWISAIEISINMIRHDSPQTLHTKYLCVLQILAWFNFGPTLMTTRLPRWGMHPSLSTPHTRSKLHLYKVFITKEEWTLWLWIQFNAQQAIHRVSTLMCHLSRWSLIWIICPMEPFWRGSHVTNHLTTLHRLFRFYCPWVLMSATLALEECSHLFCKRDIETKRSYQKQQPEQIRWRWSFRNQVWLFQHNQWMPTIDEIQGRGRQTLE